MTFDFFWEQERFWYSLKLKDIKDYFKLYNSVIEHKYARHGVYTPPRVHIHQSRIRNNCSLICYDSRAGDVKKEVKNIKTAKSCGEKFMRAQLRKFDIEMNIVENENSV